MKRYLNEETFAKEKTQIKKEMLERKTILEGRTKLVGSMQKQLDRINEVLETYDNLDLEFFREIPGSGLVDDWCAKILGA